MMTIRLISDPWSFRLWLEELDPVVLDLWRITILAEAYWLLSTRPRNPNRWIWRDGSKEVNFAIIVRNLTDNDVWLEVNAGLTEACLKWRSPAR